jgi:hypothetical protein
VTTAVWLAAGRTICGGGLVCAAATVRPSPVTTNAATIDSQVQEQMFKEPMLKEPMPISLRRIVPLQMTKNPSQKRIEPD